MKKILLFQKIQQIKAASKFEHKLIDSIYNVMLIKRKAEFDYKLALESVNRQLERYIYQQNGFLTEIVKAFQSYITVIYTNQNSLIDGYDNEILQFLVKAKTSSLEEDMINRVNFFDKKITQCQNKILQTKKQIRQNQTQIQVINSEVRLAEKVGDLKEDDKKKFALSYNDLSKLKQKNQQTLEFCVDGMMELTMTHNQILKDLEEYESVYLQKKGSEVFDNFMRAFVLEVSYIKSLQFDVGTILQKVKQNQEQHKKVALDALSARMKKQNKGIKTFIWDTYKKMTDNYYVDIKEDYIAPRVKEKWGRVCEYYNQAAV